MRGEKLSSAYAFSAVSGSPPHARGKACLYQHALRRLGITPACAGKSFKQSHVQTPFRDHPRMRGEKRRARRWMLTTLGSPPHARGKAKFIVKRV